MLTRISVGKRNQQQLEGSIEINLVIATVDEKTKMASAVLSLSTIVDSVVENIESDKSYQDMDKYMNIVEAHSTLCGLREKATLAARSAFLDTLTSEDVMEELKKYKLE